MELELSTCPKIIDEQPCGLPTEIVQRYDLLDNEGTPMSHVVTLCISLHSLHGPETMLPVTTMPSE
jgi:hypothetical protein